MATQTTLFEQAVPDPSLGQLGGFPHSAFESLYELEAGNFWFRARNALILWAIERFFGRPQSFLEIGCGTGYVLSAVAQRFPEAEIAGSDLFAEGLAYAQKRLPEAQIIQLDARNIPYRERFSHIGMFDVLEHIHEDVAVLSQVFLALKPGGGLLISVPQHQFLWSYGDEQGGHVRRYSQCALRQKLLQAGFDVRYSTSFVTLLLPLLLIKRFTQRKRPKNFDPMGELKDSTRLNGLLSPVMWLERLLIQAGVRLPWGGSLLMVAVKPNAWEL